MPKTQPHANMTETEKLAYSLQVRVEGAQTVLERFKENFAKDPSYALEWGFEAFKNAATVEVCTAMLSYLERPEATIEAIRAYLTKQALRGARNPSFSTSPTSNLMAQLRTSEEAELLDKLRWYTA